MKKIFLMCVGFTLSVMLFSQKRFVNFKSAEQKLNEEYCTGLFKTPDGTYFDMLDNRTNVSALGYANILDWLQGRVAGLQVYKTRDYRSFAYLRNQRAAIFVDEMPVPDDYLNTIPVTDIAMIKVIKDPFVGGFRGPGGAIAIYTVRGGDEEEEDE